MIKPTPLISIVIPCYNRQKFICETIESALAQTYPHVEVVVVDDGSTDNTRDIVIDRYQTRIKYIQQQNRGAGAARNTGILAAAGEWIFVLDSDDVISSNYLSDAINLIENEKTLVTARAFYVDVATKSIPGVYPEGDLSEINVTLASIREINQVVVSSLFSKKIWQDSGGYNEKLKRAEDWEFWVNLVSNGVKVKYLTANEPYFKYRKHDCQKSLHNQRELDRTSRFIKQKYKLSV